MIPINPPITSIYYELLSVRNKPKKKSKIQQNDQVQQSIMMECSIKSLYKK